MRITGGNARGIPLLVPKGDAVRPATDALRQAVFSSIAARVAGATFWDFFAGSGAYGLEAFSRGAAGGVFVEKNARAADCIRQNLAAVAKSLGCGSGGLRVLQADATTVAPAPAAELVFIDPPYALIPEIGPALFARLSGLLAEVADPLVVFEMPGEMELAPPDWIAVKRLGQRARQPSAVIFRASRAVPAGG